MKKELLSASFVYLLTVFALMATIYPFWKELEFNLSNILVVLLLIILGWGYMFIVIIFTPKKKMEDSLTALTQNIIHELNIPLSTIKANSMMLKKNITDEKSLKRLQRIDDSSIRLKKLYDELVYSINKQIHPIEKEIFNIEKIIKDRIVVFEEQKRNSFELSINSYTIKADKIGFEQIFDNLITNAMKYSPKDSTISITLNDNILKIEDSGVGMNETELLRLYERYYQANDNKEGQGIGLSLVREYCDEQNIKIDIKSQPNIGTKIYLSLINIKI
ncbi:MAG: HAMP domain-containing sensor histidine kinase [Sulfurovum sp.]